MDNTRDLSKFGFKELEEAQFLITNLKNKNWEEGNDMEFSSGLAIEFNPESGHVFLVDEDCNCVMNNDKGKLENWICCFDCGLEGFRSEVEINEEGICLECSKK